MIKRDTTETIYEYDKEGKLIRKTVTETHEEDTNTSITYPHYDWLTIPCCGETNQISKDTMTLNTITCK